MRAMAPAIKHILNHDHPLISTSSSVEIGVENADLRDAVDWEVAVPGRLPDRLYHVRRQFALPVRDRCCQSTVGLERAGRIGPTTQVGPAALPNLAAEPEPHGLGTRLDARADVELAEDRRDVVVDRLLGEHEPLRDLGVAETLRDEHEYLELTRSHVGGILLRRRPWTPR